MSDLYIIGFRHDPKCLEPDIYTIMLFSEDVTPAICNKKIIFFKELHLANHVLLKCDNIPKNLTLPSECEFVCDITQVLYTIQSLDTDVDAVMLDSLNLLFDLIDSLGLHINGKSKGILYKFLDHITFSRYFKEFLITDKISRTDLLAAAMELQNLIILNSVTFVGNSSMSNSLKLYHGPVILCTPEYIELTESRLGCEICKKGHFYNEQGKRLFTKYFDPINLRNELEFNKFIEIKS